jgi:hypothetical protein
MTGTGKWTRMSAFKTFIIANPANPPTPENLTELTLIS